MLLHARIYTSKQQPDLKVLPAMARTPSVLMGADKEVAPSPTAIARARALLSPSRRRRQAWHTGARGRGPSVQRWAATSHHRAWCAVPTASNEQRRRTKKVSCVCGLFHSGLVVMRCTRALSGWPRRVRSGGSPSVVMCKQCWRVDNESITTRARSTQVRQIDVWVTTEDPRGPRQVRLWWSRAGAPR